LSLDWIFSGRVLAGFNWVYATKLIGFLSV